jgi:large subunit ribosomal protein L18
MSTISKKLSQAERRKYRIRNKIWLTSKRPFRLSVHKSSRHIACQVIDIKKGNTILGLSTKNKELKKINASNCNKTAAILLGDLLGQRVKGLGITQIVFDKGPYKYHGVIQVLADNIRKYVEF